MRIKSILLFLVCFLLSGLAIPTIACPPFDCGDCRTWNTETGMCDWDCSAGQCCEDDSCVSSCPGCKSCDGEHCYDDDNNCSTCKECNGGDCELKATSECDVDSDCGDPDCWNCVSCECECDITVNSVTSNNDTACVGCDITFTANVTGSCSCVDWSGGGTPASSSGSCSFTTKWNTAGVKTVTATPDCGSSNQKQVTIVKVESVTSNYSVKCIGCDITFTVTTDPPGHEDLVEWSGGGDPSTGSGSTFTTNWDTWGTKTVTATCGDSSESKQVTIVEVDYVTSNKDTACVNCYVQFTVTTKPPGKEYLVKWSGGQSPPTGSGETFNTKWAIPDTKTVKASCCDSSKTKDVTIICPSGENTSLMSPQWLGTLARFQARLTPYDVDCSCIQVKECVGGTGQDFCWRPGDEANGYYPWTEVTGTTWGVETNNWYGPDLIGWAVGPISYYRSRNRAPCHNVVFQDMKVIGGSCGSSYQQNQLEAHIGTTTLTSKRDDVSTTRSW